MTPYSDYLAVGLGSGFAHLGYNLGGHGQALLVANQSRIDDDRWHTIRVHRSQLRFLAHLQPPCRRTTIRMLCSVRTLLNSD